VVAGAPFADAIARACECRIEWRAPDGRVVAPGTVIGVVRGPLNRILRAERPMLNLLQRACGIASATRAYVQAVEGTGCRILHTRKTAPGLRSLDIAAVLSGGGARHRLDLSHEMMVKDNHWQALRQGNYSLGAALAEARAKGITSLQVEVESLEQLEQACAAGATRLLVDNQPADTVRSWAVRARSLSPGIEIEATGGITLGNVREYAEAGADFISIGALTHSVIAADLGIEVGFRDARSGRG
jgi:nicotinate-nucleotide pyrophosphorylase (carboxylating)